MLCPLQVIGPLLEPQAEIHLEKSCVQFKVEVRCRRLNGSGYWSGWSMSYTSVVYNRKGNIINIVVLLLLSLDIPEAIRGMHYFASFLVIYCM